MSEVKTCRTCAHREVSVHFGRCARSGVYCSTERAYPTRCGKNFEGWEPRDKLPTQWTWWHIALVALLFLTLGRACHAQKLLWRIEIHGTDTVAVGPAGDIDSAFVRWSLRGKALRECKWDLKWKQDEVEGLYRERDKCEELRKQALRDMKAMRENEEALNDRANKWQRKAKKDKVSAVPYVGLGFGIAMTIAQPASPIGPCTMAGSGLALVTIRIL